MSKSEAIEAHELPATGVSSKRWWQRLILYPTAVGAILGAIPTGIDLYKAFAYDIEYSNVQHAEEQQRLWMKNFACAQSMSYQQVKTTEGITVQVGACTNGDVLIEVVPLNATKILEWISLDRLRTASVTSSLSLIGMAHAGPFKGGGSIRLAQTGNGVVCQAMQGSSKIVRVVRENGKCYREEIEVLKGKVVNRREVPCSAGCN